MSPIPCPSCGAALPPSPTTCPACGIALTGPDAARLWQVDQDLARLTVERRVLLAALRAQPGRPAQPTQPAQTTRPAQTAVSVSAPADRLASAPPGPRRSWTTQQTLLAVGVLLVLAASAIGLAIAWFLIGRYGQVLVMGGVTAAASVAALALSRRRLPSSAEALAVVAGGLMLLDVAAARGYGLFGLDAVDGRAYTAVTGLLVAVVLAALHRTDRRVAAFALLSLTSASVGWAGVVAVADGPAASAALALVGAAAFTGAHLLLPESLGLTRRAATGPAAGWSVVALLTALGGALAAATDLGTTTATGYACVVLLAVLGLAGVAVLQRVARRRIERLGSRAAVRADWSSRLLSGDWRAVGVLAVVTTLAFPSAVLGLALLLGAPGTAGLSVAVAAAGIGLVSARPWGSGLRGRWAEAEAVVAGVVLVAVAVSHGSEPATVVTLLALALLLACAAVWRPAWRVAATAAAGLSTTGAVALAGGLVSPEVRCLALAALGLALVAAALVRPRTSEELPLAAVGALSLALGLLSALEDRLPDAYPAGVLVAITTAAAAGAVLRRPVREALLVVAHLSGPAALWLLGGLGSDPLQWTLLAVVPVVTTTLALWRRDEREEPVLGLLAMTLAVGSVAVALWRDWPHAAAGAAAAYGLLAVGYAALPRRRGVVALGVVALTSAVWLELAEAGVSTAEAYTLSLAALLLAAGTWSRRELGQRSWLVAGPALVVGLGPSALLTVGDDGLVRPLLTVTAAVALLVLGAARRWQAPVAVGAVAAVVVALTQLGPVALEAPRPLTLGSLGVLLLVVGARYEQRRADARAAASWLASLS
jgi:hypothetical protein